MCGKLLMPLDTAKAVGPSVIGLMGVEVSEQPNGLRSSDAKRALRAPCSAAALLSENQSGNYHRVLFPPSCTQPSSS